MKITKQGSRASKGAIRGKRNVTNETKNVSFAETSVSDFPELTETQREAARRLACGERSSSVALAVGVSRTTLYRWREDLDFANAVRQFVAEDEPDHEVSARMIARLAYAALKKNFSSKNPDLKVALQFLEKTGLLYQAHNPAEMHEMMRRFAERVQELFEERRRELMD